MPASSSSGAPSAPTCSATAGSKINLGRDCRLSSPRLRNALIEGLKASGCQVTDIGVVPTPVLYYSVFHLKADGAVMITGSHNPAEYNGFKIVCGASTIHGEEIQEVRRHDRDAATFAPARARRATADVVHAVRRRSRLAVPLRPAHQGRARRRQRHRRARSCTAFCEKLNVEATELFFEMDGRFPNHHPDPTVPENLRAPDRQRCEKTGADLGIAFDGDSDRIGAVDEKGDVIYGDQLMIIYAPRDPDAQAGRDLHRRSEVLADRCTTISRRAAATPSCGRPATR